MKGMPMRATIRNESGIALVLSLFLMAALSVVAASLMFLSQTETYSSMNYRLMSQARYGAESGIQKTVNFLLNNYTPPVPLGADDLAKYDTTKSPVTCLAGCAQIGQPIVLSGNASVASNYPVAAVQTAFSAAAQGSLPSGTTTVAYVTSATLMSMQRVQIYGAGLQTIQTWLVTADGNITAGKTATVEVTATLETQKLPVHLYAAFGTNPGCGSLTFGGHSKTDSYDSSTAGFNPANPVTAANGGLSSSGGNVGTNGNLGESGNATIDGTLSSPRVGVGACSAGNVDALTSAGHAKLCPDPNSPCTGIQPGAVAQLPQAVTMPTPAAPSPMPPTTNLTVNSSTTCASFGLVSPATCSGSSGNFTITPNGATISLGNVSLTGGANLTLAAGTYNVNSISFAGNSTVTVTPGSTGTVVMNVAGKDSSGNWLATPIDFTGGSFSNTTMDPSKFQIEYAGTGAVNVVGGNNAAAMVMAPNATATLSGDSAFYGALVTSTLNVPGNADIHYDRHLSTDFYTVGNPMMNAFSWKKY
jgi:hypothetical protein